MFRRLKRDLGVIDFGDQIELAMQVATAHPEVGREYRDRFGAVLLDEYQDTNVAQARLMRGVVRRRAPGHRGRRPRPEHLRVARGVAVEPVRLPHGVPEADGVARRPGCRCSPTSVAARASCTPPTRSSRRCPRHQRPDPDKRLVPFEPNGEGEVTIASHRDELTEARGIAERIVRAARRRRVVVARSRCCAAPRGCSSCCSRRSPSETSPPRSWGSPACCALPEVVEVLAYARAANDAMASVALARILMGPRYRVGFKDLALVAGWAKGKNYAWREEGGDDEETPFLFAEALEHLDEVEGLSDEGRARLEEFRDELAQLRAQARRPVPEFLGEVIRRIGIVDELDADVDRACRGPARA